MRPRWFAFVRYERASWIRVGKLCLSWRYLRDNGRTYFSERHGFSNYVVARGWLIKLQWSKF